MPTSSASTSKEEWRTQFRAYRRSLFPDAYRARGALISSRVLGLPVVAQASVVHAYWPQMDAGEVDTRMLIGALRSQNVTVVLPVVTSYEPSSPSLEHRVFEGRSEMQQNRWGIWEPVGTKRVPSSALDAIIVPALGAGRNGHRVGHGSGYYDAFLRGLDAAKIGLVYDECLVPHVSAEPHDVPLTTIVTESQVLHVASDP